MENVYELLNHAKMDLEEFENQRLSDYESKAAKKQISKEIRSMKNSRRAWKKTLAAAAVFACVILGMGTVSAAAGWLPVPDSFKKIFGINTDEEIETANTMGTSTDVVAEDNGYKISAEGIIGDGKNMAVVVKIEKSDGSPLLENGRVPAAVEFRAANEQAVNDRDDSWSHGMMGSVDGSNHADSIEYFIVLTYRKSAGNHVLISLEDMQLLADDGPTDISGKWELDIPFEIQDTFVNLARGQKFKYGNSEGTIDELMISPIGFSVRVTTADQLTGSDFIDMPMEIHLKNGEAVELGGGCGPEDNGDGTWSWRQDGIYGNMILLDNMESIVIGDTAFPMK